MKADTNTLGHRQWYYFSIKTKIKRIVKFNIYRFKKPFSLYQKGMKPYVLSLKEIVIGKNDVNENFSYDLWHTWWKPDGCNIQYIN